MHLNADRFNSSDLNTQIETWLSENSHSSDSSHTLLLTSGSYYLLYDTAVSYFSYGNTDSQQNHGNENTGWDHAQVFRSFIQSPSPLNAHYEFLFEDDWETVAFFITKAKSSR